MASGLTVIAFVGIVLVMFPGEFYWQKGNFGGLPQDSLLLLACLHSIEPDSAIQPQICCFTFLARVL
jgi:hypothetical protein